MEVYDPGQAFGDNPDALPSLPAAATVGGGGSGGVYDPGGAFGDNPLRLPSLPSSVGPSTPLPAGFILYTAVASFPVQPGQDPLANTGQSASVQMLSSSGVPYQSYQGGDAASVGSNQYQCAFQVPPGFSGSARFLLTSGPNIGQVTTVSINLGQAVDLSDVSWTLGPPQTDVSNPASGFLIAGSNGVVHFQVSGVRQADGSDADPTANPVQVALTPGDPAPEDFQNATWLTTPASAEDTSPAGTYVDTRPAGFYACLALSVAAGTALPAGTYRGYVQINGTTLLRCPGFFNVRA